MSEPVVSTVHLVSVYSNILSLCRVLAGGRMLTLPRGRPWRIRVKGLARFVTRGLRTPYSLPNLPRTDDLCKTI